MGNKIDVKRAMMPPPSSEQEKYSEGMGSHADMMAHVLMGIGRLEAKIDMMIAEDKSEDKSEDKKDKKKGAESSGGSYLATNPALFSNQLEFDNC